jgi:hypothetical protein
MLEIRQQLLKHINEAAVAKIQNGHAYKHTDFQYSIT